MTKGYMSEPTVEQWVSSLTSCRHVQSSFAKINVGSGTSKRTYYIHRSLLEARCGFFHAALTGKYLEPTTAEVNLPEDKPEAFDHAVRYFYGAQMRMKDFNDHAGLYVDTYILADKLLCTGLKDVMIDMMQEYYRRVMVKAVPMQRLVDKGLSESKMMNYLAPQAGYELAKNYWSFMKFNTMQDSSL